MNIGEINLNFYLFIILFISLIVNTNTALHLLLTAELLWISLFSLTLLVGLIYDNINLVSLTFFFLVLSAVEFGIGLILMLFQNIFTRSINLNENDINFLKFNNRFKVNFQINKIIWKS